MRIHSRTRNALWFGPARGRQPIHRFDDPTGRFRVGYFGTTIEVCFAETFLRNPPVRILALRDLTDRSIATVELRRDLRLVPIHGSNLARLGVTAELVSASDTSVRGSGRGPCGGTLTSRMESSIGPVTMIGRFASPYMTVPRMVWQPFRISRFPKILASWRDF